MTYNDIYIYIDHDIGHDIDLTLSMIWVDRSIVQLTCQGRGAGQPGTWFFTRAGIAEHLQQALLLDDDAREALGHLGTSWDIPSGSVKHSYWKWLCIVDFPIKNGGSFHSYVNVYQRVVCYAQGDDWDLCEKADPWHLPIVPKKKVANEAHCQTAMPQAILTSLGGVGWTEGRCRSNVLSIFGSPVVQWFILLSKWVITPVISVDEAYLKIPCQSLGWTHPL